NAGNGILEAGGSNIAVAVAGTYTVSIKLGIPDYTYTIVRNAYDHRAMFWSNGQTLDINDIGNFNDGYAVTKWKNVTRSGAPGSNLNFEDIDFPMFRLGDVYLMYAEAVLRGGGGGDLSTALTLVNNLRTRAYGDNSGNITADQLTLPFILDERGRELYWEGYRRTDLVRFGELTTSTYLWPWKGGVSSGVGTDVKYNIFPLPAADVSANPNLKQNPGY
ncbi:MAG: RagB/SusD family nutrient uptake outer membrane protein, partial [Bacteroidales bacterium]